MTDSDAVIGEVKEIKVDADGAVYGRVEIDAAEAEKVANEHGIPYDESDFNEGEDVELTGCLYPPMKSGGTRGVDG